MSLCRSLKGEVSRDSVCDKDTFEGRGKDIFAEDVN